MGVRAAHVHEAAAAVIATRRPWVARLVSRLASITLLLFSVLIGLLGAELLLRAAGYRYSPVRIGDGIRGDFREQHAFHDRSLVYDPNLIWRPISRQFSPFNPQGFRGHPVVQPKPAGTFRIIALGDSNTFGWDVDEGVNWPSQLQRRLSATSPRVEVVNAGVWGYSSFQGVRRFTEVLAFSPDMVLISYGGNDAHQVRVSDADYVTHHDRIELLTKATRRSRLAQLLVAAWDRLDIGAHASAPMRPRVSLEEFTSHLREIILVGRTRGIRVVLLTRPFQGSSSDPASWKTYAPQYNAATLAIGHADGVPVIDVYAAFRDRADLFDDESHFGAEGHRVAAELIHGALAPLIPAH